MTRAKYNIQVSKEKVYHYETGDFVGYISEAK